MEAQDVMTRVPQRRLVGKRGLIASTVLASGLGTLCAQAGYSTDPAIIETAPQAAHVERVDGREHIEDAYAKHIDPVSAGTLNIKGSAVSCGVARLEETMPDSFYLTHALDGSWSPLGCPFLDRRSTADGAHLLIYGHHIAGSNMMFSSLQGCYAQKRFNDLESARWTPTNGKAPTTFIPFCALRVPATYGTIQRFSFAAEDDLERWLHGLAEEAEALNPAWKEQAARAEGVLTTVTCTEGNGASRHRTIVVFTTP